MEDKITLLQAYKAMFEFLRDLYYREGQPGNLGSYLGELQILEDGKNSRSSSMVRLVGIVKRVLEDEKK